MNKLTRPLFGIALAAILILAPGCASLQPDTKAKLAQTGSWLLGKAVAVALSTVVSAAQSQTDADNKADWLDSLAAGFRSEATASFSGADVRRLVEIWTPANKPHWQDLAGQLEQLAQQAAALPPEQGNEALARAVEIAAQLARAKPAAAFLAIPLETIDFHTERIVDPPAPGAPALIVTRIPADEIR